MPRQRMPWNAKQSPIQRVDTLQPGERKLEKLGGRCSRFRGLQEFCQVSFKLCNRLRIAGICCQDHRIEIFKGILE